jgi:hypothetical protein
MAFCLHDVLMSDAAEWPRSSAKHHGCQEPLPRGAVKVREATAKRLDLDGEPGDGSAAFAD